MKNISLGPTLMDKGGEQGLREGVGDDVLRKMEMKQRRYRLMELPF
jgi:hypothetical protein